MKHIKIYKMSFVNVFERDRFINLYFYKALFMCHKYLLNKNALILCCKIYKIVHVEFETEIKMIKTEI